MNDFTARDFLILAAIVVASLGIGAFAARAIDGGVAADKLTRADWLLSAPSDAARFRLLQQQLRGFDQPMWEVGERFRRIHEALVRQNYDLALYHWDKIDTTIRNGIAKRPARAATAQAMFLGRNFQDIRAGLAARAPQSAWDAFERARIGCQSCHQAENVAFVNQQPLFDLAPPQAQSATAE